MKYYLDTEFDGFSGPLLSLAMVCEDGRSLYVRVPSVDRLTPWVAKNVWPIMDNCPVQPQLFPLGDRMGWAMTIYEFLSHDNGTLTIVADWPDDVRHFCDRIIVGPGKMINIPGIRFEVLRVDAYPTELTGAVRHNAWWDAMALRERLRMEF